ncbi:MAG: hypothetical protein L6R36_009517 [Xanthoria steineri]|nr:MAG: hypothetical protein L6R36_009517 [Xanthoria steineri]
MSKEKPLTDASSTLRAKEKKEKSSKKAEKRSETSGVTKKSKKDKDDHKKERKEEKKKKKDKSAPTTTDDIPTASDEVEDVEMTTQLLNTLSETNPGSVVIKDETGDLDIKVKAKPLLGALVPFAVPLVDEKVGKKVLKGVKKAARTKTLKRGVKEVVKALRKSSPSSSSSTNNTSTLPAHIVILAADISPMDVISHLPVLCEDHGVPYVFVPSRAELGAAGSTKRPTSVVMVAREKKGRGGKEGEGKEKEKEGEGKEDWGEVYAELVKVVVKAGKGVRV